MDDPKGTLGSFDRVRRAAGRDQACVISKADAKTERERGLGLRSG